ncbi:MAG: hypothetical protein ABI972_14455 [Acidobacteriota bacterium]
MLYSSRAAQSVLVLTLLATPLARAEVISYAGTSNPNNQIVTPGTVYSRSEASTNGAGDPVSISSTSPPPCPFPCLPVLDWESGAASIDSATGKGRSRTHVSTGDANAILGASGGTALAGFQLTDTLLIDRSSAFGINLDIDFSLWGLDVGSVFEAGFGDNYFLYQLTLTDILDPNNENPYTYTAYISGNMHVEAGVPSESYEIVVIDGNNPPQVLASGNNFLSVYSLSASFDALNIPPGAFLFPFALDLRLDVSSTCQVVNPITHFNCSADLKSTNSSYIGLSGNFTSQNGYQYLGTAATNPPGEPGDGEPGGPGGEVPEPTTFLLVSPALAALAYFGRRRT